MKGKVQAIVIDDNALDRLIVDRLLRIYEFSDDIQSFASAEECLVSLSEAGEVERIIFLDINMPGMDGFAFLKRYRDLPDAVRKNSRIVILSSSVNPRDKEKSTNDAHVVHYISKPLTKEKLTELCALLSGNN